MANLKGLQAEVREALEAALREARENGIPLNVTSAYRSQPEQDRLKAREATNPYPVAKVSLHTAGRAVDIHTAPMTRGALTRIMEKHGFRWAGTKDRVHYSFVGAPSPFAGLAQKEAAGAAGSAPASPFAGMAAREARSPFAGMAAREAPAEAPQSPGLPSQLLSALMRGGNVVRAGANEFTAGLASAGGPGEEVFRNTFRAMREAAAAPLSAPPVPPSHFTNLFQQQPGDLGYVFTKPADYLTDFLYNAADIATGKGVAKGVGLAYKGAKAATTATRALPAVAQAEQKLAEGVGRTFTQLAESRAGAVAVRAASALGEAPGAKLARELSKKVNRAVGLHGETWGKIVVDMGRRTAQLRPVLEDAGRILDDPYDFGPAFRRLKEGASPAADTALSIWERLVPKRSLFSEAKEAGRKVAATEASRLSQKRAALVEIAERQAKGQAVSPEVGTALTAPARTKLAALGAAPPESVLKDAVLNRQILNAYRATGAGQSPLQSAVIDYVEEVVRQHPERPLTYADLAKETEAAIQELTEKADQHLAAWDRHLTARDKVRERLVRQEADLQKAVIQERKVTYAQKVARTREELARIEAPLSATPAEWRAERSRLTTAVSEAQAVLRKQQAVLRNTTLPAEQEILKRSIARDRKRLAVAERALERHKALDLIRPETAAELDRALTQYPKDLARYRKAGNAEVHGELYRLLARGIAGRYGVPTEDVVNFGRRVLDHFEETVAMKRAAGGVLFRGETAAQQRQRMIAIYLREGFSRPIADAIGSAPSAAYQGGGIRLVREAALDGLERQLVAQGIAKPVIAGEILPGHIQIPSSRIFGDGLHFKQVPVAVYNMLRRQATMAGRPRIQQGLKSPHYLVPGDEVTEELAQRALFGHFWTNSAVPGMKRLLLNAFPTQVMNLFGNHVFAGIGAAVNGKRMVELTDAMSRALPQVMRYVRDRTLSPAMERLAQHTDAFWSTTASTATRGGYGDPIEAAGMAGRVIAGRVVNPPKIAGTVLNAPLHLFDIVEKTYKLALFELLEKSLGAEGAAREVDRWLFNYADQHPFLQALDRAGLWVFNYFPTQQAGRFVELLSQRPDLLLQYPRFRALLFEEFPGARDAYNQLRPDQKGLGTLPISGNEFVDVTRAMPLVAGYDTAKELWEAVREKRAPQLGLDPRSLLARTIVSPEIAIATNQRLNLPADESRRIVPEGVAPNIARGQRWQEWLNMRAPGFVRVAHRVSRSLLGVSRTPGRTTEPESVGEALVGAFLGIKPIRGETQAEANARVAGQLGVRVPVVAKVIAEVIGEVKRDPSQLPEGWVNRKWQLPEVHSRYTDAYNALRRMLTDPTIVSRDGTLVDRGKVESQVRYLMALFARQLELAGAGG